MMSDARKNKFCDGDRVTRTSESDVFAVKHSHWSQSNREWCILERDNCNPFLSLAVDLELYKESKPSKWVDVTKHVHESNGKIEWNDPTNSWVKTLATLQCSGEFRLRKRKLKDCERLTPDCPSEYFIIERKVSE